LQTHFFNSNGNVPVSNDTKEKDPAPETGPASSATAAGTDGPSNSSTAGNNQPGSGKEPGTAAVDGNNGNIKKKKRRGGGR